MNNKVELITEISKKMDTSLAESERFLNTTLDIIGRNLKKGGTVRITNFGTFKSKYQEGRSGVNPLKPTETITIPSMYRIYFSSGEGLKGMVNGTTKKPKESAKKGNKLKE